LLSGNATGAQDEGLLKLYAGPLYVKDLMPTTMRLYCCLSGLLEFL